MKFLLQTVDVKKLNPVPSLSTETKAVIENNNKVFTFYS